MKTALTIKQWGLILSIAGLFGLLLLVTGCAGGEQLANSSGWFGGNGMSGGPVTVELHGTADAEPATISRIDPETGEAEIVYSGGFIFVQEFHLADDGHPTILGNPTRETETEPDSEP